MEAKSGPSPTEDLISFVHDVVDWTHPISLAYLDDEQLDRLDRARGEIREVQLPEIERQLLAIGDDKLKAAGFSPAQTAFKLGSARSSMAASARRAQSPLPERRKKVLELLDFVVENVQTVLGSLSSLSMWIEAAAELVGVVGSGVKATVAETGAIRRAFRKVSRRRPKRDDDREHPEEAPPSAPAVA